MRETKTYEITIPYRDETPFYIPTHKKSIRDKTMETRLKNRKKRKRLKRSKK